MTPLLPPASRWGLDAAPGRERRPAGCWCGSLVLEVILQGLGQRQALDLLEPLPAQRHAGRTPAQVHQRERFSCRSGEAEEEKVNDVVRVSVMPKVKRLAVLESQRADVICRGLVFL